MGGSLSKKRLTKPEFEVYLHRLWPTLGKMLGDVRFTVVPYYTCKKDFGDIDFVVCADAGDVLPLVEKTFDPEGLFVNDGIISFTFEDFQVDLICTLKNYDTSLAYFSYNDIGNLLGRIYHKLGLKFGHEGLLYPLKDARGGLRDEVVVSTDIKQIISFLGCDPIAWEQGFTTMEDIFRFVSRSRYFDRNIFEGELSAINKKRDLKRKTFSYFLTWLEIAQPLSSFDFSAYKDKDDFIPGIEAYFGVSILHRKMELEKVLEKENLFKDKFNGDLLMMLTPLKGNELGRFLGAYKRWTLQILYGNEFAHRAELTKENNNTFEDIILSMTQEDVNNSISKFFAIYSK